MLELEQNKFITAEIEETFKKYILKLNSNGLSIPMSVEEISEFPYESFDELKNSLGDKKVKLLRHSAVPLLGVAARLNPALAWTINGLITVLLPILSIGLAIFYSWWYILGLCFFFVGLSRTKELHNYTIFKSAMTNELAFCFLFYAGQISVFNPDCGTQYYDYEDASTKIA